MDFLLKKRFIILDVKSKFYKKRTIGYKKRTIDLCLIRMKMPKLEEHHY